MNVGLFADCDRPAQSGVVTSVIQLKDGLERRGHQVTLLTVATPPRGGGDATVVAFPSLPFSRDNAWRMALPSPQSVQRIARRAGLEIVHTHTEFGVGWAGKRAARALGLPWVHTAHTLYEAYRHYLPLGRLLPRSAVRRYLAWFLQGCGILVCPSDKAQRYFAPLAPAARTAVVGNAVDTASFGGPQPSEERARTRAGLGLAPSARVLLHAGRLGREKRVAELLLALAPLLRPDAGCRLLLVGAGPQRGELCRMAARLELGPQVILAGPVPWESMPGVYRAADLLITASLSENHPMTCLEAIACGLPIAARRDEAYAGLVQEGVNGCLADTDEELAEQAMRLLADEATRRAFSENSVRLSAHHGIDAHVERIEALYREAGEPSRPHRS